MSVPRPAMLVAIVTACSAPACAMIVASCSWKRAFSTECFTPRLVSSSLSSSLFSMLTVPTSTGCPRVRASSISAATASNFSRPVRYTSSSPSFRTTGTLVGTSTTESL